MESNETKKCPYCAEIIKAEAIKCRYCGHMLREEDRSVVHWRRIYQDKRIAGVCNGIAHELSAPRLILPLRLFFILSTVFYGFGLILYIVLWILMPAPVDVPQKDASRQAITGHDQGARGRPLDIGLSLLLVATGVLLMLVPLARSHLLHVPLHGIFGFPRMMVHNIQWIPGLWISFILLGLLLIFVGALRAFRFLLGFGLILLGALLLFLFIPFMPRFLFFPGLVIIGLILFVLGGIKLAFGPGES